jgi:hypothetical protein
LSLLGYKTAASIVLLIPGLLIALFKLAAYFSSDVKDKHALIKKHLTEASTNLQQMSSFWTFDKNSRLTH